MYARLTTFPLLPGSRAAVEEGNDEWARLLAAQPGHRRTVFYFTATEDQFGSISTWDTREAAEAVTGTLGAALAQLMGPVMQGPPPPTIVEVVYDAGS